MAKKIKYYGILLSSPLRIGFGGKKMWNSKEPSLFQHQH